MMRRANLEKQSGTMPAKAVSLLVLLALFSAGCSVKKMAVNALGSALAESGKTYASDNDPELVGEALPFALKLIESVLAESPEHQGLLEAASSGFTQYAYAYVNQKADEIEPHDLQRALYLRQRARKLFLRARDYGLRALEGRHRGFVEALQENPRQAAGMADSGDVPLLYWTAAAWGSAISVSKDKPRLVADQLLVEALIDRALELDEDFDHGAIHSFLISYEAARQGASGEWQERSKKHYERAVALSRGQLASPHLALAETVAVHNQDREQFEALLAKALAVDPDARPEWRLANLIAHRRARWLQSRADALFLEPAGAAEASTTAPESPAETMRKES